MMAAVAETVERFGGLDVVVANAGIAPEAGDVARCRAEEWERVIEVNLLGRLAHGAARPCRRSSERQRPASSSSPRSTPSPTACCTAPTRRPRRASSSSGRALRVELAPLGASATVAYFGWVDTEMVRDALDRQHDAERFAGALPRLPAQADHARRGRRGARRAGSRSGRRASSRRAGGATSRPCAA